MNSSLAIGVAVLPAVIGKAGSGSGSAFLSESTGDEFSSLLHSASEQTSSADLSDNARIEDVSAIPIVEAPPSWWPLPQMGALAVSSVGDFSDHTEFSLESNANINARAAMTTISTPVLPSAVASTDVVPMPGFEQPSLATGRSDPADASAGKYAFAMLPGSAQGAPRSENLAYQSPALPASSIEVWSASDKGPDLAPLTVVDARAPATSTLQSIIGSHAARAKPVAQGNAMGAGLTPSAKSKPNAVDSSQEKKVAVPGITTELPPDVDARSQLVAETQAVVAVRSVDPVGRNSAESVPSLAMGQSGVNDSHAIEPSIRSAEALDQNAIQRTSSTDLGAAQAQLVRAPLTLTVPMADTAAQAYAREPVVPTAAETGAFVKDLAANLQWMSNQRITRAEIQLNPAELGPVDVSLSVRGEEVRAEFLSAHSEVRQALEAGMPRLREMFSGQGLQLLQADVGQRQTPDGHRLPHVATANAVDGSGDDTMKLPIERRNRSATGLLDEFA